jgi:hypothetical protein
MIPSIYINLEDDVPKVIARIKKEKNSSLVLVCPKRCFLFNDSINLRLLKKQTDLLGKEVFILTMDERGQMYAKEAGFSLKFLPQAKKSNGFSDVVKKTQTVLQPMPINEKPKVLAKPTVSQELKAAKQYENQALPQVEVKDVIFPKEVEETYKIHKKSKFNQSLLYSLSVACLVVVLVLVFLILPKAKIVLYAKAEPVTRDIEVAISTQNQAPDVARLLLPASKVSNKVDVSGKFSTQGKKEVGSKASGLVRIYNFTKLPINLKASTTSFTLGNRNYVLVKDAMGIKPTVYKNSQTKEVDEVSLSETYEIVSEQGGESYNIPAGTRIEITNQIFGSRPLLLYAKTQTPISGGNSRYLSVMSEQDLSYARQQLGDMLLAKFNEQLKAQNLAIVDKAYVLDGISFVPDKPAGTESPSFNATLSATVNALAFKPLEMENLINARIKQTILGNKTIDFDSSAKMTFKLKTIDLASESATILAHFEGFAFYNINPESFGSQLTGKSQNQASEILRSKAEIDTIEITLAPTWQKNLPFFNKRIEILVEKKVNK